MAEPAGVSLDEFKARLPIAEVVGRHVQLSRRGRDLWGCCPFHSEKTASFHVVPDKGFYHCFGCGAHGNAIDFVMAVEGLDFGQALARLAELTGLPAPRRPGGAAAVDQGLYAANEAAARWFAGRLESRQGARAAEYLHGRGLDAAIIGRFGLGYAPDEGSALKRALLAEGFAEPHLVETGLVVRPEDGSAGYDRFRDRVIFPIHDKQNRVVGFGGRTLGGAKAKYLNTPETPLFRKGELLYGVSLARAEARRRGTVVVVEGYMDVIALARAGLGHAVAPLGTAITEAQLALLWQLADEPVVCLDSDEAGLRAGHRLLERALPLLRPGKSLRFALMPQGADPDDVVRRWGAASMEARLGAAKPLLDFLWDSEVRHRSLDTPERRAALRQRLRALAQSVADRDLRFLFQTAINERWQSQFGARKGRLPGRGASLLAASGQSAGTQRLNLRVTSPAHPAEWEIVAPVLVHPELLHEIEEELAALEFLAPELETLRREILGWYGERGHLDLAGLSDHLCGIGFASLVERLSGESPMTAWYRRDGLSPDEALERWRACVAQQRRLAERRAMREANAEAIAQMRENDARVYGLAVDRLINEHLTARPKGDGHR